MGLMDVFKESQALFVNDDDLGLGEAITYTHRESGLVENIRAFIEIRDNHKDKTVRQNEMVFSNVILSEKPVIDDRIDYNGTIWKVSEDIIESMGMYIIPALNNTRHNGRHGRRNS